MAFASFIINDFVLVSREKRGIIIIITVRIRQLASVIRMEFFCLVASRKDFHWVSDAATAAVIATAADEWRTMRVHGKLPAEYRNMVRE